MISEAATCRKYVVPQLQRAGWETTPHSIIEQKAFTDACIADYLDSLQSKVDAIKALQAETEAELNALLPAVLDRAFRGEL